MGIESLKILLVEDNPVDARVMRELIGKSGVGVTEVVHVQRLVDAAQELQRRKMDLAILDLGLPDSHGLETIGYIQKMDAQLPVIVTTGYDDTAVASLAIARGATDYIIKGELDAIGLRRALRCAVLHPRSGDSYPVIYPPECVGDEDDHEIQSSVDDEGEGRGSSSDEVREGLGRVFSGVYKAEKVLGVGGMGVVYYGVDSQLDREVAIKVMARELNVSTDHEVRFTREAKILASLEHPAIVPIYAYGKEGEDLYFVMPYVRGTVLSTLLRGRPLMLDWWRPYMKTICDGLEYAHGRGVIHRDLKPENIVIQQHLGLGKLLDFGIARDVTKARITMHHKIMGTPLYMAPEQSLDTGSTTALSDQYSLGAIVYEVLTGRPPFLDDNPLTVLIMHQEETPEPIGKYNPSVDDAVEAAVLKALAKYPSERFESCLAFYTELIAAHGEVAEARSEHPTGEAPRQRDGEQDTETDSWEDLEEYVRDRFFEDILEKTPTEGALSRLREAVDALSLPFDTAANNAQRKLMRSLVAEAHLEETLDLCRATASISDPELKSDVRMLLADFLEGAMLNQKTPTSETLVESLAWVSGPFHVGMWKELISDPSHERRASVLNAVPIYFDNLMTEGNHATLRELTQVLFWAAEDLDETASLEVMRLLSRLGVPEVGDLIVARYRSIGSISYRLELLEALKDLIVSFPHVPERIRQMLLVERRRLAEEGRRSERALRPKIADLVRLLEE